jgi:hypothetical protein
LTVADGTITLSSLLDIGVSTAASGTVWLTGGQVWVTNGCTYIGDSGVGCMTVSNGTFLAGEVRVGLGSGSQGTLIVAGGSLNVLSNMVVGNPTCSSLAAITMSGGTLSVTNGATTAVLEVRDGTFTLTGGRLVVDQLVITNSCGHFMSTGGTLAVGSVVLDPNMSAVGDGIPNGWKLQYGLNPFDANLGNEDNDSDGLSNLQEYLAGTDPINSASAFRITAVAQKGADIRITWQAGGGRTNVVQAVANPGGAHFNISPNIVLPGAGDIVTNYLDKGGATNTACRFYRVALASSSAQDTTAPTLVVTSPADNSYTTNSAITVTGTSADASGVAGVMVNGLAASSANGYSNWTVIVSRLGVGTNTLTVLAGDNAAPANFATNVIHVIYAAGSFDGNGDGLPDLWQIQHFGCVGCPQAAPGSDPDGDGLSNLQESLAGTSPTNSASALRITAITRSGNDIRISWTAVTNKTYVVQVVTNFTSGAFANAIADLATVVVPASPAITATNYLDIGAVTNGPSRIYRIRLIP